MKKIVAAYLAHLSANYGAEVGVGGTLASLSLQTVNHVVSIGAGLVTVFFVLPGALLRWRTAWLAWKHDHGNHPPSPPAPQ